jgi:hypothetical protein
LKPAIDSDKRWGLLCAGDLEQLGFALDAKLLLEMVAILGLAHQGISVRARRSAGEIAAEPPSRFLRQELEELMGILLTRAGDLMQSRTGHSRLARVQAFV